MNACVGDVQTAEQLLDKKNRPNTTPAGTATNNASTRGNRHRSEN